MAAQARTLRMDDMSAAPTRFTPEQARPLIRAVFGVFLVNGLMIGVWGGSMPGLRDRVHTDSTGVGLVLVSTGLAAICSMQVGGRISDRITPRLPTLISGFLMVAALLLGAFAPNYPVLLGTGVVLGIGNGTMDVAMNALAIDAEQASGRAVMSRFHAFFSLGGFLGAAIILFVSRLSGGDSVDPRDAVLLTAALAFVALVGLWAATPAAPHAVAQEDASAAPDGASVPPQAWLLGVMALFFGFTEGTAIDWASIHVTDVAHVSASTGAAGLVAVSATMVVIRLLGDYLVTRYGRVAVVRFGAPVAVLGYAVTTLTSALPSIITGWLLVGLGVGMIAPQIYGIAGHLGGGRVLALVTGCGYAAFLIGPALIGFVSAHIGIQHTMALPLTAGLLLTALTFTSALREPATR